MTIINNCLAYIRSEMGQSNEMALRAGSHFEINISISISQHTQKQCDADNQHLLLGKFPTKGANCQHRTASGYVGLCLCLCQSVNQP